MRSLIRVVGVGREQMAVLAGGVVGAVLKDAFGHGGHGVELGEGCSGRRAGR